MAENKQIEFAKRTAEFEPGDGFEPGVADMEQTAAAVATMQRAAGDVDDLVALYDEPSYTIPELADKIRKSVTVTRRYIDAGRFPNYYKDGPFQSSKIRVPQRDLDAYMAATVKSKSAAADGAE